VALPEPGDQIVAQLLLDRLALPASSPKITDRVSVGHERSAPLCDPPGALSTSTERTCCCNVKMSSPNCSVKRSSLNGDLHVEPEGTASAGAVEGAVWRAADECPGGRRPPDHCAAGPAAEAPVRGRGPRRARARQPRPSLAPAVARGGAGRGRPAEDVHGYVTLFRDVFTAHGLPMAVYGDRLNLLVRNDAHWSVEEQLAGTQAPTHVGRILQNLAIGYIAARSPQAKGRIERLWNTLQD